MKVRHMFASVATCETAQAELEAYILEELPTRRAERISRHLQRCSDCREDFRLREEMFALVPSGSRPGDSTAGDSREPARPGSQARATALDDGGRHGPLPRSPRPLFVLILNPLAATSLVRALQSPDVAVINLFAVLDAPLSARYEYRTESHVRFDRSVGRIPLQHPLQRLGARRARSPAPAAWLSLLCSRPGAVLESTSWGPSSAGRTVWPP